MRKEKNLHEPPKYRKIQMFQQTSTSGFKSMKSSLKGFGAKSTKKSYSNQKLYQSGPPVFNNHSPFMTKGSPIRKKKMFILKKKAANPVNYRFKRSTFRSSVYQPKTGQVSFENANNINGFYRPKVKANKSPFDFSKQGKSVLERTSPKDSSFSKVGFHTTQDTLDQ